MIYAFVTVACLLAQSSSSVAPPVASAQVPKPPRTTADDYELFLENILEAPRGQRKAWNGKCYNAPHKIEPSVPGAAAPACLGGVCPLPPAPRPVTPAPK